MDYVDRYQPRSPDELIGQTRIVAQVKGMAERQRFPQRLLIVGPTGVGKTSLARIIAYLVNGVRYGKPLPDMQESNVADERGIDDVRGIIAAANYMPERKFRVIILDEVHKLTPQAAPALLKGVENAPEKTMFILVTNQPQNLLPELVRRCYIMALQQPSPRELIPLLQRVYRREQLRLPQRRRLLRDIASAVNGQPALALFALQAAADQGRVSNSYSDVLRQALAIPQLANERLAVKCLACIYRRKQQSLLELLIGLEDGPGLVQGLLNCNRLLLQQRLQQEVWLSPLLQQLVRYVAEVPLDQLIAAHNRLLDLQGEMFRFIFPERQLIFGRLLRLTTRRG